MAAGMSSDTFLDAIDASFLGFISSAGSTTGDSSSPGAEEQSLQHELLEQSCQNELRMQDDAMDVGGLDENLKQVLSRLPKELQAIVTKAPCGPNCTRGCLWAAFTLDATNTDLAIQARDLMNQTKDQGDDQ